MKKKTKYRLIYLSIFLTAVILAGVLAFALYKLSTEYIPQQKEAQRFAQLRELANTDETDETGGDRQQNTVETTSTGENMPRYNLTQLFSMNSDMVGWLTIPDTVVDYPVMHTPDDVEYYLHTDFDRHYSFSGCLFVGDNCDINSDAFVIYGHNMNNGSMFGDIDLYTNYSYWAAHPDIVLTTESETRLYKVFAAFATKVYAEDEEPDAFRYYDAVGERSEADYRADIQNILALSSLDTGLTPVYPAQIAYLSTCAYHEENGRFVLAAYRIA